MNRSLFGCVLGLSLGLGFSALADTPHWTQPYNIVWTTPGTNGLSSMPAGGGKLVNLLVTPVLRYREQGVIP